MDLDTTFRPIVVVAFFTIIAIAVPFRIKSQSTGESLDRRQEGLATMFTLRLGGLVLWASVITFMIRPGWMSWSSLPVGAAVRWSGVALCAVTALLLMWTLASLGKNLTDTVVTRRDHSLVTRGPYRWVRHPFYDCMCLFMLGTALAMANWFVIVTGLVVFAILAARSRTEEDKLLERFGEPYRLYQQRTGRFLPGVGRARG
jgi:protein-S-isoprenylcysteine O-methyltransferase Ste14